MESIEEYLVKSNKTVYDASKQLDEVKAKALFVIDDEGRLTGSFTGGDLRRWIVAGRSLQDKIVLASNPTPKFLYKKDRGVAKKYIEKYGLQAIPIVDDNQYITDIVLWNEARLYRYEHKIDVPIVIMAGGMGTRLYPYTKVLPKALMPIGDTPIIEMIIDRYIEQGSDRYYIVLNHKAGMIKAYLSEIKKNVKITFVEESKPLGTAGGLSLLKDEIGETFILNNCDILVDIDLYGLLEFHNKEHNLLTIVSSLQHNQIPYGVLKINDKGKLISIDEKPVYSYLANTGCYMIEPNIFNYINKDEETPLTKVIQQIMEEKDRVGVYPISEKSWVDIGEIDKLKEIQERIKYII